MKSASLILGFSASLIIATSALAINVSISGAKNTNGNICMSIFEGPEAFPDQADGAIFTNCSPVGAVFEPNLAVWGKYAIAIFHDENENGILDKVGAFGIPQEGFGFSNNPAIRVGPPKFEQVAFELTPDASNIGIQLNYLLD